MKTSFASKLFVAQAFAMIAMAWFCEAREKMHDADRLMECALFSMLMAIYLKLK